MTESTLRRYKPDAWRLVEAPTRIELIRRTTTEIAVDVYDVEGTLLTAGVLEEVSENASVGQPAAVALADGWWCTTDTHDGVEAISVILWKPGETPLVYDALDPMPDMMPLWDPVAERLIWVEFSGAVFGTAYEWTIRSASLSGFPSASNAGTLTVDAVDWPAGTGGTRTSIELYRSAINSAWLNAEFLALEAVLQLNYAVGAPSAEIRHVRIQRGGAGGIEENQPTPDPANVFVLPSAPSGLPIAVAALDGIAVGGIEGAASGLRVIDDDGLWGADVWTGAIAAGQYVTGIHQRPTDGRWAVLTDDGSTSRVYIGDAGVTPSVAFEVAGTNYRGIRIR